MIFLFLDGKDTKNFYRWKNVGQKLLLLNRKFNHHHQ